MKKWDPLWAQGDGKPLLGLAELATRKAVEAWAALWRCLAQGLDRVSACSNLLFSSFISPGPSKRNSEHLVIFKAEAIERGKRTIPKIPNYFPRSFDTCFLVIDTLATILAQKCIYFISGKLSYTVSSAYEGRFGIILFLYDPNTCLFANSVQCHFPTL